MRGGAVWQLVGLITRRSQVQILPPLPPRLAQVVSVRAVVEKCGHGWTLFDLRDQDDRKVVRVRSGWPLFDLRDRDGRKVMNAGFRIKTGELRNGPRAHFLFLQFAHGVWLADGCACTRGEDRAGTRRTRAGMP